MPTRYDDIWTAAKGCYKAQPAMAERRRGHHLCAARHRVSETHHEIYDIGYHCIDSSPSSGTLPGHPQGRTGALHARARRWDVRPRDRVETNRIHVTLATGIPREVCEQVNLGYLDPREHRHRGLEGRPRDHGRRETPARSCTGCADVEASGARGGRGLADDQPYGTRVGASPRGLAPPIHRQTAGSRSRRSWSAARRRWSTVA